MKLQWSGGLKKRTPCVKLLLIHLQLLEGQGVRSTCVLPGEFPVTRPHFKRTNMFLSALLWHSEKVLTLQQRHIIIRRLPVSTAMLLFACSNYTNVSKLTCGCFIDVKTLHLTHLNIHADIYNHTHTWSVRRVFSELTPSSSLRRDEMIKAA